MPRMSQLKAAARERVERRVRHLPAARRLRFELTIEALERFAPGGPLELLDAGCGEGLLALTIAQRHPDWRIAAADLSEEQLEQGRLRAEKENVQNVRFVRLDLTQDLGAAAYDAVAAVECLEEIPDDAAALGRMARALRPGGLFVAHVPERDWKPVLRGSDRTWRHEVRHGYAEDELVAKLERAGLEVTAVRPTSRGAVRVAQEIRDRIKNSRLMVRALAYPGIVAAVRLERWGVTWGPPRALFVEARRR